MRTPKEWSANAEDWWCGSGLDKTLREDGFEEEAVEWGDQLFELYLKAAEDNGWTPEYEECCEASELPCCLLDGDCDRCIAFKLFWLDYAGIPPMEYKNGVTVDHVMEFSDKAITGNLDVMLDAWLADVPVEHILGGEYCD